LHAGVEEVKDAEVREVVAELGEAEEYVRYIEDKLRIEMSTEK
jgi:hypothetical protein